LCVIAVAQHHVLPQKKIRNAVDFDKTPSQSGRFVYLATKKRSIAP
jgi:hypothetical protein